MGPGEPEQTAGAYERFVNNLTAASLEGLVAVPKVYALAENTVVAPRPDPEGYGVSRQGEDTAPVMAASALLEGKELLWSPERETLPGREIRWYSDETIFAVSWRENINRLPFTLCEVVVAHPSQLRRYLADNSALSFARWVHRFVPNACVSIPAQQLGSSGPFCRFHMHACLDRHGLLFSSSLTSLCYNRLIHLGLGFSLRAERRVAVWETLRKRSAHAFCRNC